MPHIHAELCTPATEQELRSTCNNIPCPSYAWQASKWSTCTKTCGTGYKTRAVTCARMVANTTDIVSNSQCSAVARPDSFELCNKEPCNKPYYNTTLWSSCSAPCGGGTSTRTATCMVPPSDSDAQEEVEDASGEACVRVGLRPPDSQRDCNTQPCDVFLWVIGAWQACNETCGGTKSRTLSCKCASAQQLYQPDDFVTSACKTFYPSACAKPRTTLDSRTSSAYGCRHAASCVLRAAVVIVLEF